MAVDVSKMTEKQLLKLQGDIEKQLKFLEKDKRVAARKAAEEAAKKHGFSLNDLVGAAKKSAPKVKYRNPADASQTWSGRGRQPGWIKEAMAAGKDIADFAV